MSRIARWLLTLTIALLAVGASFGSALAAPGGDSRPRDNAALERAYKTEQLNLRQMDARLHKADGYADRVANRIAQLKAKNQDTAPLEQALAAFRDSMGRARQEWQAASDSLTSHAGFDDQGKVTNADQARATLKAAHEHMQRARSIGREAYRALHAAFANYRKTHRGVEEPQPPEQP